jgi:N-hydroxyarylamine O-acetyltransferase
MTFDLNAYFARVKVAHQTRIHAPSAALLCELHYHHMLYIPFENLDIPLKQPITINVNTLYDKIVKRGRGGFCYELNTLFGAMLEQLGYRVRYIAAQVWSSKGYGLPRCHMALLVDTGVMTWLVDVGFGDSFVEPLRFVPNAVQPVRGKKYRIIPDPESGDGGNESWLMQTIENKHPENNQLQENEPWVTEYRFETTPLHPADFVEMCDWTQTSPDSVFTNSYICSRAVPDGRISIANNRMIRTVKNEKFETPIKDAATLQLAFIDQFGIHFSLSDTTRLLTFAAKSS